MTGAKAVGGGGVVGIVLLSIVGIDEDGLEAERGWSGSEEDV